MPPRHNDLFKPLVLTALVLLVAGVSLTSWGRRLSAAMLMPFVGVADWAAEGLVQSVRMLQPGHHARKDHLHQADGAEPAKGHKKPGLTVSRPGQA